MTALVLNLEMNLLFRAQIELWLLAVGVQSYAQLLIYWHSDSCYVDK